MDAFGGARPKNKQTKSDYQNGEIPLEAGRTTSISRSKLSVRQSDPVTSHNDRKNGANLDVMVPIATGTPSRTTGLTSTATPDFPRTGSASTTTPEFTPTGSTSITTSDFSRTGSASTTTPEFARTGSASTTTPDFAQTGSTSQDFRPNSSVCVTNFQPANILSAPKSTQNSSALAPNFTQTGSASLTISADISQTCPTGRTVPDLKFMNRELLVIIQAPLQHCRTLCECGKICGDKSNSNNSDFLALHEQTSGKFAENGKQLRKHNKRPSEEKITNMSVKEKWRQSGLALKNYVSGKLGFKNKKVKKSEALSSDVKDAECKETFSPGYVPQNVDFVPEKLTRSRSLLKYLTHKKEKVSKSLMNGKLKKSSSLEMSSSDRPISSSDISSAASDWSSESASTNQCSPSISLPNEIMCNKCTCSPDLQLFCKKHKCRKQCKKNKTTKPGHQVTHHCTKLKPDKTSRNGKDLPTLAHQRELLTSVPTDSSDNESDGYHNTGTACQRSMKTNRNRKSRHSSRLSGRQTEGTNDRHLSESTLNVLSGLQYAIPYLPERFRNRLHVTTETGTMENCTTENGNRETGTGIIGTTETGYREIGSRETGNRDIVARETNSTETVNREIGTTETGLVQSSCDTSKTVSSADSIPVTPWAGRGTNGRGKDRRETNGRGRDQRGYSMMEIGKNVADSKGRERAGTFSIGDCTSEYSLEPSENQQVRVTTGNQHPQVRVTTGNQHPHVRVTTGNQHPQVRVTTGNQHPQVRVTTGNQHPQVLVTTGNQNDDVINGYTHDTKPMEQYLHKTQYTNPVKYCIDPPGESTDVTDDLVYLSEFESSLEDPFNVRSHTDSSNELCSGILDIVRTADHTPLRDIEYVDFEASYGSMENKSNTELCNTVSADSDVLDFDIYSMPSSDENNYFSKALLPEGTSDMLHQPNRICRHNFHDFHDSGTQSGFDTGSNQSTLTGFYDQSRMEETNSNLSMIQDYPGYKALNDSFDRMLQENESGASDSPFREHLQRSRSNESGLRSRSSDGLRSRSSDENVEADDEFECDCGHCQFMLTQHDITGDNVVMTTEDNINQTSGESVSTTATNDYQQNAFDDFHVPFDLALYTDTAISEHDAEHYRSTNSWDIGFPFIPNIPLLLSGSPLGELLEDVIEHMLAARPELFLDEQYPPARKDVIDSLPTVSLTLTHLEQNPSCPICLCVSELEDIMTVLPCQHIFHPLCIQAWLTKSGTCPVCRRKIRSS